jgi:uncharacterized membrane protein YkoI
MRRRLSTALSAIILSSGLLLATSCASTPGGQDSTSTEAPADATDVSGRLDALGAIDAALKHSPGAVVEMERATRLWEVTVLREDGSGTELYINVTTKEVIRESTAFLSPTQRQAPAVTAADAIGTAIDEIQGRVIALDLGTERGTVVWEVLVSAGIGGTFEVYIDAATGGIVKIEREI